MKNEKGVTLIILVIYVILFSVVMGLLATLSNYIYNNLHYVNDASIDISEFNKFNMYFIEDVKSNKQVEISKTTNEEGKKVLQIVFEDGDSYNYIEEEKSIYKNKQKIAKNIEKFTAQSLKIEDKTCISVNIKIGAKEETNYSNDLNYVLKYW